MDYLRVALLTLMPLMIGSLFLNSHNRTQFFDKTENTIVDVRITQIKEALEKKVGEASKGNENQQLREKLSELFFHIPFNSSTYETRKVMFSGDNFFDQQPFDDLNNSLVCDFKTNPLLKYLDYSRGYPSLVVWFKEGKSYSRKILQTYYSKDAAKCEMQAEDLVEAFKKHSYRIESNKNFKPIRDKSTDKPTGEWEERKGMNYRFYSSAAKYQEREPFLYIIYLEYYSGKPHASYRVEVTCMEDNI